MTLLREALGALWIAIPVLLIFGICELLFHYARVDGEATRKVSHVGAGFVVLSMPWVVGTHWTVLVLAAGFALVLGGSKKLGLLPSVHRVSRKTSGAVYYPIAVYVTFLLAGGDPLLYGIPMLVMAISDTGAAVVGRRFGIVRYRVIEDHRSLGGSVTFFALTFAVVLVGLGVAGFGDLPTVLLITLMTAMVATAVEGISVRGADNLFVPYATFVVLRATTGLDREGLGLWVLGAALVLGILMVSYRRSRLSATAFMAAFVAGLLAWGLCGPVWLVTLLVPYAGYAVARPLLDSAGSSGSASDLRLAVSAFAVSLVLILAYGHTGAPVLFVPFVASVASVGAIGLAGLARRRTGSTVLSATGAVAGAVAATVPALLMAAPVAPTAPLALLVVAGALPGPLVVSVLGPPDRVPPALLRVAGVAGGTAASLCWVAVQALV